MSMMPLSMRDSDAQSGVMDMSPGTMSTGIGGPHTNDYDTGGYDGGYDTGPESFTGEDPFDINFFFVNEVEEVVVRGSRNNQITGPDVFIDIGPQNLSYNVPDVNFTSSEPTPTTVSEITVTSSRYNYCAGLANTVNQLSTILPQTTS